MPKFILSWTECLPMTATIEADSPEAARKMWEDGEVSGEQTSRGFDLDDSLIVWDEDGNDIENESDIS